MMMIKFIKNRLHNTGIVLVWLFFNICLSVASLASAEVLRQAVNAIEESNLNDIKRIVILAAVATIWIIIFEYANRTIHQLLHNRFSQNLQLLLYKRFLEINKKKFSEIKSGNILTLIQDNVENAVNFTLSMLQQMTYGIGMLLFSSIYMAGQSVRLMLIVIICNIIYRILTRFFDQKVRRHAKKSIEFMNESNSFFMEIMRNEMIIRVFDRKRYFESKFAIKENSVAEAGLKVFAVRNGYSEITWYASTLISLIFIYGIGGSFVLKGYIEISVLIAFTKAMDSFVKGMNSIIEAINDYNNAMPHIDAIEKALDIKAEDDYDEKTEINLANGDICFEDVSFSFGEKCIFEHLNLTIHNKDKVMITGPNGRGKSTFFGLLLGFYRPQSGRILIGGEDTSNYTSEEICRLFGYVPQEAQILYGSVNDNVAFDEEQDKNKIKSILGKLHLETIAESDPLTCSSGEKQRINIGRAMYHDNRPVLLGDEIFANIDPFNKNEILRSLAEYSQEKTVLLICHEETGFPFTYHLHFDEETITYTPLNS